MSDEDASGCGSLRFMLRKLSVNNRTAPSGVHAAVYFITTTTRHRHHYNHSKYQRTRTRSVCMTAAARKLEAGKPILAAALAAATTRFAQSVSIERRRLHNDETVLSQCRGSEQPALKTLRALQKKE